MRFPIIARQNTPPGSPTPGQRWIVGASPTGAWAGQANKFAVWRGSDGWKFISPVEGDRTYDQDANEFVVYDGTAWIADPRGAAATVPQTHLADNATGTLMARAGLAWGQQGTGDDAVAETVSTALPRPYWRFEIPHPGSGGDTTGLRTRRDWQIEGGELADTEAVEFAFIGMSFSGGAHFGVYVRRDATGQAVVFTERGSPTNTQIERRGGFGLASYGSFEDGGDLSYPSSRPQPVTLVRFRRNASNIEFWWSMEGAVWNRAFQFGMTNAAMTHCGVILWRNSNQHCSLLVLGCRKVTMP